GPATDDDDPVPDELLDQLFDAQRLRPVAHETQQDHADGRLQRAVLEELIQNDLAVGIAAERNMNANLPRRIVAIRQVRNAGDSLNAVVFDELFELFANAVAGFEIGNFGHD